MRKSQEVYKKQVFEIGHLYFNEEKRLWQIARELSLNPQTVWRNIEKYREWNKESLEVKGLANTHLVGTLSIKNALIRECWKALENESLKAIDKVKLMRLIIQIERDKLNLFEKFGLLENYQLRNQPKEAVINQKNDHVYDNLFYFSF